MMLYAPAIATCARHADITYYAAAIAAAEAVFATAAAMLPPPMLPVIATLMPLLFDGC